jgi:hypothetical protein
MGRMMTFEDDDESLACDDIGFDPAKTQCTGCEKMAKYVKDDKLTGECFECCVEDRKRYGQASLHVCKEGLSQMEELNNFIKEYAESFEKLKIVYDKPKIYMGMAMCSQPSLKLQDDSGNDEEVVEINGWKKDQLKEYLEEKVPNPN